MPGWRSCLVSTCDLNRDTISRAVTDRVTVISTVTDRDRMIGLDLHINTNTLILMPCFTYGTDRVDSTYYCYLTSRCSASAPEVA
jgi:hypothetical protein